MHNINLFIGDSLTEWGNWDVLFPGKNIVNKGIAGNKTADILKRLPDILLINPEKVFCLAGINDLGEGLQLSTIIENYTLLCTQFISRWKPENIHLLSVLPVDFASFAHTSIYPENINKLNHSIAKLAAKHGTKFIDMYPAFTDTSGNLNPKFTCDGLHLSNAGYQVWKKEIETYL
jgi:lysophospholipase L1-like esterase